MRDSQIGSQNAQDATSTKRTAGLNLQISVKEQSPRLEGKAAAGLKPRQDAAAFHQDAWIGNEYQQNTAQKRVEFTNEKVLRPSRFQRSITSNSSTNGADRGQILES